MSFGPTLQAILVENQVTQTDVARLLEAEGQGVTLSAVGQWIQGRTAPRSNILALLLTKVCRSEEQRSRLLESMSTPHPSEAA